MPTPRKTEERVVNLTKEQGTWTVPTDGGTIVFKLGGIEFVMDKNDAYDFGYELYQAAG